VRIGLACGEGGGDEGVEVDRFDDAIGEDAAGDAGEFRLIDFAIDDEGAAGADFADRQAHVADGHLGGIGDGVHHAWLKVDFDAAFVLFAGGVLGADDDGFFNDGIGEEFLGDLGDFLGRGGGIEEEDAPSGDWADFGAHFGDFAANGFAGAIDFPLGGRGAHINAIDHARILVICAGM
jgi:hypothetical protein